MQQPEQRSTSCGLMTVMRTLSYYKTNPWFVEKISLSTSSRLPQLLFGTGLRKNVGLWEEGSLNLSTRTNARLFKTFVGSRGLAGRLL